MTLRRATCGTLRLQNIGERVTLYGWVQRIRDKGKLLWIDLRDRDGITQLVVESERSDAKLIDAVRSLGREYVIEVEGKVHPRLQPNPKLSTGEVEVAISHLTTLNTSATPPFMIEEESDGSEPLRMQYRYLDLRRAPLQRNLKLRAKLTQIARHYLEAAGFWEIDTPMLVRSTPEGARDFVVPSRREGDHFYALPQSPQLLKQLLMVAGMDRYFQFARCFRDEDLRADRQPEFTQLDCELSFAGQEEIMALFEGMVKKLFIEAKGVSLQDFPVMHYEKAMALYGSDKPDLRFGMELIDLSQEAHQGSCPLWQQGDLVAGIVVEQGGRLSRKVLDQLQVFLQEGPWEVGRMTYIKYSTEGSFTSPLTKWYTSTALSAWGRKCTIKAGETLLLVGGAKQATQEALGALRLEVIKRMELPPSSAYAPLWIIDFPLLEWDHAAGRYHAKHHPFTAPKEEDLSLLAHAPSQVRAQAYDMVINGVEIGGGSLRIHKEKVQRELFSAIGLDEEVASKQFGALLTALKHGAPPHGGIALGWERLCLLIGGGDSIRDYMAFPKNNTGRDVMLGAPSPLPSLGF